MAVPVVALLLAALSLIVGSALATSPNTMSGQQLRRLIHERFERAHKVTRSGPYRPLPAAVASHFRVFEARARALAHASSAVQAAFPGIPSAIATQWGLALGDAQQISNNAGLNVWVVPGSSGMCLVVENPQALIPKVGGNCVPNADALAGLLVMQRFGSEDWVIGAAPNGNASVTVTRADGSSQPVPVASNGYVATSDQPFHSVALRNAAGEVVSYHVPGG